MKATNHGVVVLWKGDDMPDYLIGKIAEVFINNNVAIPEMLTIKYKDEDGISNALVRDANLYPDSARKRSKEDEALENAVIYIGKRFEVSLANTNGNPVDFAIALISAIKSAKERISFNGVNTGDNILTAVEIISTTDAVIPNSLVKKYHFTQKVVETIKKVYNSYC